MKHRMQLRTMVGMVCLMIAGAVVATAQSNVLEQTVFPAGGGTSTAGVYTITGTIAQPDTGRLHSRDFTIDGGSWGVVAAIQEPGAPVLSVRHTQTNTVVVSWPIKWPGFVLQESLKLDPPEWSDVTTEPLIDVTWENRAEKRVIVPQPAGRLFYRLRKSSSSD